ncbi:MAG TPA: hypothetical protein VEV41_15025 [Terriglobales bacterium]|nr:hypothetical protein [Terriglobales bacterium]
MSRRKTPRRKPAVETPIECIFREVVGRKMNRAEKRSFFRKLKARRKSH